MKPILFNAEMVRAIQDDRKTVTRRVVKPQEPDWNFCGIENDPCMTRIDRNGEEYPSQETGLWAAFEWGAEFPLVKAPYRPGDILYVRETWQYAYDLNGNEQPIEGTGRYLYAADDLPEPFGFWVNPDGTHRDSMPWRPSIHMPREAARIFLRVTDVRVERLQDIKEEQARAEGVKGWMVATDRDWDKNPNYLLAFQHAWDSTIKPADRALYGWDANPWVWVIAFERISREEAQDE